MKRTLILAATLGLFCAYSGMAIEPGSGLLVEPAGQATADSCQSYVLALALAFKADPSYRLSNAAELRRAELGIRAEIVKSAAAHPQSPGVNHDDIRRGFEAFTSDKYTLRTLDTDLLGLADTVASRTGVTDASALPPAFLLGAAVKDVVLSSATRIGANQYKQGHLFTLLGVDGPPNSNRRFLILNSAVKVRNTSQDACSAEVPDDPGPYTASVSWRRTDQIELKPFGGKYKAWTVERK